MTRLPPTRRDFLCRSGMGLGMLGLAGLCDQQVRAETGANSGTHHAPRARRMIHIFLNGGPSHIDTFDPKAQLTKYSGRELPVPNLQTESPTGRAFPSPFAFQKYGDSGIDISDLFPHLGPHADQLCVIRSMQADIPFHEPSLMLLNCGESRLVRPSMGSWLTWGLGSENENLPGFIAMCPGGHPVKGPDNWRSAFLPGAYQGTFLNTERSDDVGRLLANIENETMAPGRQRRQLDLLRNLNRLHQEHRKDDRRLEARIASFEQAFRMQSEAVDAFDISKEPRHIHQLYGDTPQARQTMMARRLVERGVRFVQLWHGEGQPWDTHERLVRDHRRLAGECSQAIGALLADLKQRDLLKDTLVVVGGEFGRTPTAQGSGRDHNHYGFSMVLAGGGVKGGTIHGATDDFGWKAVQDPVHVHDLHATILHLFGLDHERLTYRHSGRDFRLTDVYGRVVDEIVA